MNKNKPYLYSKIESIEDINKIRNEMVNDGHYPASMTDCEVVGINGDCNECPIKEKCKND